MVFTKEFWINRKEEMKDKFKKSEKRKNCAGNHKIPHNVKTKINLSNNVKQQYENGKVSPFKNMSYEQRLKQIETRKKNDNYNRTLEQNKKLSAYLQGIKLEDWKGFKERDYSHEFCEMRKLILKRDKFKCRLCNKSRNEGLLDIHHIDSNTKNNSIFNLITLCQHCHHSIIKHNDNNWKELLLKITMELI
jgi:hypothetical protein